MDTNTLSLVSSIVSIIVTIVLGSLAIWLALYLFKLGNQLQNTTKKMLADIEASARVTEFVTIDVLKPTLDKVLSDYRQAAVEKVDTLGENFILRTSPSIEALQDADSPEDKAKARQAVLDSLNALVDSMRHQLGRIAITTLDEISDNGSVKIEPAAAKITTTAGQVRVVVGPTIPGSPGYDWLPFIRRMRDLEETHNFLSLKWLHQTKFAGDNASQDALQVALDNGMLEIYYIDNPKNPEIPTKCCRLNRGHEQVNQILEALGPKGP